MTKTFIKFLHEYWHENADLLYKDIGEAALDFVQTEKRNSKEALTNDIEALIERSVFPPIATDAAHKDFEKEFGSEYHRLVTRPEADLMLQRLKG